MECGANDIGEHQSLPMELRPEAYDTVGKVASSYQSANNSVNPETCLATMAGKPRVRLAVIA